MMFAEKVKNAGSSTNASSESYSPFEWLITNYDAAVCLIGAEVERQVLWDPRAMNYDDEEDIIHAPHQGFASAAPLFCNASVMHAKILLQDIGFGATWNRLYKFCAVDEAEQKALKDSTGLGTLVF